VTPEHIDLFVDRICGYFPTTNIARNTVKSAWRQEDSLIDLSEDAAKKVLQMVKNEPVFPTLQRINSIIRMASKQEWGGYCGKCERGWIYVESEEWEGRKYPVVGRCVCSGGRHESKVGMQEVFDFIDDIRTPQ